MDIIVQNILNLYDNRPFSYSSKKMATHLGVKYKSFHSLISRLKTNHRRLRKKTKDEWTLLLHAGHDDASRSILMSLEHKGIDIFVLTHTLFRCRPKSYRLDQLRNETNISLRAIGDLCDETGKTKQAKFWRAKDLGEERKRVLMALIAAQLQRLAVLPPDGVTKQLKEALVDIQKGKRNDNFFFVS